MTVSLISCWLVAVVTWLNVCVSLCVRVPGSLCGYEPFYSDNEAEMFKKIMKCDYVFDSPWWDDVSDNAKVRRARDPNMIDTMTVSLQTAVRLIILWGTTTGRISIGFLFPLLVSMFLLLLYNGVNC